MEEEAPVTAATGALGPVIAKLAALLGSAYKLRRRTRRDVKFIRSKLKPVHSILWNIWEREELDEASKALKMEALDLADDVDDAIVDFIISMERSDLTKRLVQTKIKESPFQDFKKRASDVSGRCRSRWKEKEKPAAHDGSSRPGKPRAYPFVRKDVSELVGMAGPRDKLIGHLVGAEDEGAPVELQLKKALIYGTAGMGKTTLADLVYEAIGNKFQSRAFVSLTPGGNTREVLATILQQVAPTSSVPLAATKEATEEDLIHILSNFLKDKRYLVIIDDIWNWREWEVIMKSLPENNLGCRIVGTTRMKVVPDKWCKDSFEPHALLYEMLPEWDWRTKGWVYKIDGENIVSGMVAMKPDLVAEGFSDEHPIVRMCGGTPLAVRCMLSAVAEEREKHGRHGKTCDVQAEIEKHVMEKGIQNTPGFEALVESLQLGYDDLPHHMLKTCLLYCSIYPDGEILYKDTMARRWISEGFVYTEEEAHGYFEELVKRGLILPGSSWLRMHPMMRNFLRWKSRQDNFTTCSSEITPSYDTCSIRRLCIDNSPYDTFTDEVDTLSRLDWYRIRSLVVDEGFERIPLKLDGLRALHLCDGTTLLDHHWKDICGLVRLRHLLCFTISEIPPEIVRLQCLETFVASGDAFARLPGFIGDLQQLKTLEVTCAAITELPREIGSLQQLQTLRIVATSIEELPREIGELQQLRTLHISFTEIRVLPNEIGELQQLRTLDISSTKIRVLPKEMGKLQQLRTLDISSTKIRVLPKEMGKLQQLRTLDISSTKIRVLPKEMGKLQQLRTLDISSTKITVLPKEMGKLQQMEQLRMRNTRVAKIPREIGALKELKTLGLDYGMAALPLEVCSALVELPECIHQAVNKSGLMSDLAGEMLSFQKSIRWGGQEGLLVGAKQMHIPPWIREHFNDISLLDIKICKLEEGGLEILREMPKLRELTLRFQVVPREPVVISSQGFATLTDLTVDSRVPRVTFQEGAMPRLYWLTFQFQFYAGPTNKDQAVGINHLRSLCWIEFKCNQEWYGGGDSPCIRPTIDVMKKEARELPRLQSFTVCGREEEICSPPPSPPPPLEMGQQKKTPEEEGEIEEDIQA